jgi:hypothetical protein
MDQEKLVNHDQLLVVATMRDTDLDVANPKREALHDRVGTYHLVTVGEDPDHPPEVRMSGQDPHDMRNRESIDRDQYTSPRRCEVAQEQRSILWFVQVEIMGMTIAVLNTNCTPREQARAKTQEPRASFCWTATTSA